MEPMNSLAPPEVAPESWFCWDRGERGLRNFYRQTVQVRACGALENEIIRVLIRKPTAGENGTYWGWFDHRLKKITMIYPRMFELAMCFTYGIDEAESESSKRRGIRVHLISQKVAASSPSN
jgi:hypothetical protein